MKKLFFTGVIAILFTINANAQTKKDGTPDMRYKSNKQTNENTATPKSNGRNYSNGGQYKVQEGYQKSNGTYVAPHLKTSPDNKKFNNYKRKK